MALIFKTQLHNMGCYCLGQYSHALDPVLSDRYCGSLDGPYLPLR